MSWQKEVEELQRRRELARELGGAERVQRQRDDGKLTIREKNLRAQPTLTHGGSVGVEDIIRSARDAASAVPIYRGRAVGAARRVGAETESGSATVTYRGAADLS